MTTVDLAGDLEFQHRGHYFTVQLQERRGGGFTWSYLLHDFEVEGRPESVREEIVAIGQAILAAERHIDQLLMSTLMSATQLR